MSVQQALRTTILLLLVYVGTGIHCVWARTSIVSSDWPRTRVEQATRLWASASDGLARKLYPSPPGAITPLRYFQRNYRQEYLQAPLHRRLALSERIGEQGRARFAAEQGWIRLLGSRNRGLRQGPDSIYWDPRAGRLRVLEAKGGSSPVRIFRGVSQNTNQYSIRAAEGFINSTKATLNAKQQAARVLVAAQQRRLATSVVKTPHVLGRPGDPRLGSNWDRRNVSREARRVEHKALRRNPDLQRVFRQARMGHSAEMLRYRYRIFKFTRIAGWSIAPVILGVEGWRLYTAYDSYRSGELGQLAYYRHVGNAAIIAAFGLGGATVGGVLGSSAGGAGAIPGALTGFTVGYMAAIPASYLANLWWEWRYGEFDDQQRLTVIAAVERHYGVTSAIEVVPRQP